MPLGYFITTSWSVVYKSKIVWLPNSMHGNKMLRCKFTRNRTGFLILTWKGLPRDIRGCPRKKVCESGSLSIKTNGLCSLDNISLPRWGKFFFRNTIFLHEYYEVDSTTSSKQNYFIYLYKDNFYLLNIIKSGVLKNHSLRSLSMRIV